MTTAASRPMVDRLHWCAPFIFAVTIFTWGSLRVFGNIDQDAWIYVTYFKRFFELPFSFQPGNVSYGATSPLHVIVMAPLFHGAGELWLAAARVFNFTLVFGSLLVVHRAAGADIVLFPAIVAASLAFEDLFQATAALFETGVTCFAVSVLISFVARRRVTAALATAGILPLARPELLLVSIATTVHLAWRSDRRRVRWLLPLVIAPAAVYLLYMWSSGAGLVPTSIVGRAIIAREYQQGWADSVLMMLRGHAARPYLVFMAAVVAAALVRPGAMWPAWLVIVPLFVLYGLQPPAPEYIGRYLIPAIPALLFIAALILQAGYAAIVSRAGQRAARPAMAILSVVVAAAGAWLLLPGGPRFSGYQPDVILQKDLASAVSGFVRPEDKVLMYEIQGQFFFPAFGVSADGIVGSEAHAFLLRRETFDQFVTRLGLKYVVTFNGFNYRPIFKGTPLVDLYAHDLASRVGDDICLGRHCYRKIITNPNFDQWYEERPVENLNTGHSLRLYGRRPDPALRGNLIQWNSVYSIRENDNQ